MTDENRHLIILDEIDCLKANLDAVRTTAEAAHEISHKPNPSPAEQDVLMEFDSLMSWIKEQSFCVNLQSRRSDLQNKIDACG